MADPFERQGRRRAPAPGDRLLEAVLSGFALSPGDDGGYGSAKRRATHGVATCLIIGLFTGCLGTRPSGTPEFLPDTQFTVIRLIDARHPLLSSFVRSVAGEGESGPAFAPTSVTLRSDGAIVLSERSDARLVILPPPGSHAAPEPETVLLGSEIGSWATVRLDRLGNVYLAGADARAVEVYDPRLRRAGEVAPPYDALGMVPGRLAGMAFDLLGQLYLSDAANGCVHRYNAAGGYVASFTGGEKSPWGRLARPAGLTCADDGQSVYVCDPGAHRVVVFDPVGTPLESFGDNELKEPVAIAVDKRGTSFVADRESRALFVFAASGRLLQRIDGIPPLVPSWQAPADLVVVDSMLWVADPGAGIIVAARMHSPADR